MRLAELKKFLNELNFNKNSYSLNSAEYPVEAYVIYFNGSEWEVYYSERGNKVALEKFKDESDACEYFLKFTKGKINMKGIDYLPLGSVVILEGGIQKLIIVSRGILVNRNNETLFFDYGGVLYPDGLTGDQMAYFNHDGIKSVLFTGYDDDESKTFSENINKYLENNPNTKRGDPKSLNQ